MKLYLLFEALVKFYVIQMLNLCIYPVIIGLGFHPNWGIMGYPAI